MSQLASLINTFKDFQKANDWTPETTTNNFLEVLGNLEWELTIAPLFPDGKTDWDAWDKADYEYALNYFN